MFLFVEIQLITKNKKYSDSDMKCENKRRRGAFCNELVVVAVSEAIILLFCICICIHLCICLYFVFVFCFFILVFYNELVVVAVSEGAGRQLRCRCCRDKEGTDHSPN